MEVDMYDPNIAAYSKIRYYELLENAENRRQWKKQQGSQHNTIIHLAKRIRNLKGFSSKDQSQAVPDQIAAMKS
jgi:transcription elongation GreA/GreB family factor